MQGTGKVHNLPGTTCSTGDENAQTNIRFIVDFYRRFSRDDHNRQHYNDASDHSRNTEFHGHDLRSNLGAGGPGGPIALPI